MRENNTLNMGRGCRTVKSVLSVLLIVYSLITIFLVGDTVISSFKTKLELVNNLIGFPQEPTLNNYLRVFVEEGFWKYILNSVVLVSLSLVLLLAVSSTLAYGMAQYRFRGKGFLQGYLLIGLMMPVQLSILPLYLMLSRVHLTNSFIGLALVYAANLSFPFTVFYQFFAQLPEAVIESARIDGANSVQQLMRITIPLLRPIILVTAIMSTNGTLQLFDESVNLTRGGPGNMTITMSHYIYNTMFTKNPNFGYAAAMSFVILVMVAVLAAIQMKVGDKR